MNIQPWLNVGSWWIRKDQHPSQWHFFYVGSELFQTNLLNSNHLVGNQTYMTEAVNTLVKINALRMKPKTRIRQNVIWVVVVFIIQTIILVIHPHGRNRIHSHGFPDSSCTCEKFHKLQVLERAGRFSVAAYIGWETMCKHRQILHELDIILLYCVLLELWEVGRECHQNHHPDKALSSSSLAVGNWQATRWDKRIIIHQHQNWSWSSMLILESCQYQSWRP